MIQVNRLSVRSGGFAMRDISFDIPSRSYAALMGRTGAGKTTLLEAICGLRKTTGGSIHLMGRDVTRLKAAERGIGYVPQDRALFSTMTVYQHLAFALRIRGWTAREIDFRVSELAELLGLEHLLRRKPHGLSGGEQQRVALGRARSARPRVLILDEPLSALDDQSRGELQALLRNVRAQSDVTTLHVTHSMEDVMQLADVLFRLEPFAPGAASRVRQLDPADEAADRARARPSHTVAYPIQSPLEPL